VAPPSDEYKNSSASEWAITSEKTENIEIDPQTMTQYLFTMSPTHRQTKRRA